ncbi:hypothetical protein ASPZODRAFT_49197, partial [Penicilliopsis zonata CBS 506.65]
SGPVQGIAGAYTGNSLAVQAVLISLLSVSLWNALELIVLVLGYFRVHRGLYFWSLLITAGAGVIPDVIGLLLKYFALAPIAVPVTVSTFGWTVMVTGQSLVLYSRLHLVVHSQKLLMSVLCMIIANAILFQIPQIVLSYGAVYGPSTFSFILVFNTWEKVQLVIFSLQEVIISSIFIVQAVRLLRLFPESHADSDLDVHTPSHRRSRRRVRIMYQLLAINTVLIAMDIALLALQYSNLFLFQTVFKVFFYSVKLKLEVAVLSRLVLVV